jgi:hypothetical protein
MLSLPQDFFETGVPQLVPLTDHRLGDRIKEYGVEETSPAYRILFGESVETIWDIREDNIKLDLKEIE